MVVVVKQRRHGRPRWLRRLMLQLRPRSPGGWRETVRDRAGEKHVTQSDEAGGKGREGAARRAKEGQRAWPALIAAPLHPGFDPIWPGRVSGD